MSREKSAKETKLSMFAQQHGYPDLEELCADMAYEKESALARIKIWNENQNLNSGMNTNKTSPRINNKNTQNANTANTDNK